MNKTEKISNPNSTVAIEDPSISDTDEKMVSLAETLGQLKINELPMTDVAQSEDPVSTTTTYRDLTQSNPRTVRKSTRDPFAHWEIFNRKDLDQTNSLPMKVEGLPPQIKCFNTARDYTARQCTGDTGEEDSSNYDYPGADYLNRKLLKEQTEKEKSKPVEPLKPFNIFAAFNE
jgi:hypothetical protein